MVFEIEVCLDLEWFYFLIFVINILSLFIVDIVEGVRYLDWVIGMYFFSLVEKMFLVEIIVID